MDTLVSKTLLRHSFRAWATALKQSSPTDRTVQVQCPQPKQADLHASVTPPKLVCLPEMPFNPSLSSPLDLSNLLIFPGPNQIAAMLTLLQQYLPTFFTPWHTEEDMVFVWHAGVKEQSSLLQKRRAGGSDHPRPLSSAPMPRAIKPCNAPYTNFHSCTCHIHTERLIVLLVSPAKP